MPEDCFGALTGHHVLRAYFLDRGVQVFKLITQSTLEEKIDRIIAKKKRLMDSVVRQDDKTLLKHFSREDLIELMSFGK